jgi:hypothetical protein
VRIVDLHTQVILHPLIVEEAKRPGYERIQRRSSNIEPIAAGLGVERKIHLVPALLKSSAASLQDGRVVGEMFRIPLLLQLVTLSDFVKTRWQCFHDPVVCLLRVSFDTIGVVHCELRKRGALNSEIDEPVDYAERVDADGEDFRAMAGLRQFSCCWVLFLHEEAGDGGTVVSAVTLCPHVDVVTAVFLEFVEPCLDKVIDCASRDIGCVDCVGWILRGEFALDGCEAQGHFGTGHVDGSVNRVENTIHNFIICEAGLRWLVDVENIGHVVPGPRVDDRGVAVFADVTRSILVERVVDGGRAGSSLQPYRYWCVAGGDITGFEEPEEDVVCVVCDRAVEACGECDVSGVALDAGCCLAYSCLRAKVSFSSASLGVDKTYLLIFDFDCWVGR